MKKPLSCCGTQREFTPARKAAGDKRVSSKKYSVAFPMPEGDERDGIEVYEYIDGKEEGIAARVPCPTGFCKQFCQIKLGEGSGRHSLIILDQYGGISIAGSMDFTKTPGCVSRHCHFSIKENSIQWHDGVPSYD